MNLLRVLAVLVASSILAFPAFAEEEKSSFEDALVLATQYASNECKNASDAYDKARWSNSENAASLLPMKTLFCECLPARYAAFESEHPALSMKKPYPASYIGKLFDASNDKCIASQIRTATNGDACEESVTKNNPGVDAEAYCGCLSKGYATISDEDLIGWANHSKSREARVDNKMRKIVAACRQSSKK